MSDVTEVFFWEHPEAQARLLALQTKTPVDSEEYDSDSVSGDITFKRLDKGPQNMKTSDFLAEELYSRRIRARDWKVKYDRLDASGVGNHRC